jgi:hypothetical protein
MDLIHNTPNCAIVGTCDGDGWVTIVVVLANGVTHRLLIPSRAMVDMALWFTSHINPDEDYPHD